MEEHYTPILTDEERAARRAQRERSRLKKRRARRRRQLLTLAPILILTAALVGLTAAWSSQRADESPADEAPPQSTQTFAAEPEPAETEEPPPFSPEATAKTVRLGEDFPSAYAILVDGDSGEILAAKQENAVISPASMTKILTLLVAVEQIENWDASVPITFEITDYCYLNDCSVVGFLVGEQVPVRELLYGTILSSGADAALALASYAAGSHEAFVDLMNEKLEELGISDTAHFTNCVGLYDPAHVCTVKDMAVILQAAMRNDLCREVLSAHTYETAPTPEHPEGQVLSNWFLRKIEDHDQDQAVRAVGAKTGYVVQSGNCAASWGENSAGKAYICDTGNAYSGWRAIYDHAELYKTYCSPPAP